jgi:5'-nucleotidase
MTPLILVINDDGIFSKGIKSLVEAVSEFGEVVVVAPDKPQSGMGHAITVSNVLRLNRSDLFPNHEAYTCSGTPVDCVKLGIYEVLKRKPDLLVSGINHGENTSTNVLYSGTMSAAVEGAMEGIPSIGFSLCDFGADADFTEAKEIVRWVVENSLKNGIDKGTCLNVNIPKKSDSPLKGIKVCKQANAFWADQFDKRLDQFGNPYYWLTGEFGEKDPEEGTDLWAIKHGYASIVPTQFDMTSYTTIVNVTAQFEKENS